MPFRIWHKNDWYQFWPPPDQGSFAPAPVTTFDSFQRAATIVQEHKLHGAEIYQLVGIPQGPTIKKAT
jgi:hypothetical protein